MSDEMKCVACQTGIQLACTNRQMSRDRYLMFCKSDAAAMMKDENWVQLSRGTTRLMLPRELRCFGCDRHISIDAHVNKGINTRIAFCYRCKTTMTKARLWEECRRYSAFESVPGYAPDIIKHDLLKV